MNEPVLFLDFNGVLQNITGSAANLIIEPDLNLKLAEELNQPVLASIPNPVVNAVARNFQPDACAFVENLCEEFDASIVVTSSWRIFHTLPELQALLAIHGISHVADRLPGGTVRSDLIRMYLKLHRISRYIVLDDMNLARPFGWHFVHCPHGFHLEEYEQARSVMKAQSHS